MACKQKTEGAGLQANALSIRWESRRYGEGIGRLHRTPFDWKIDGQSAEKNVQTKYLQVFHRHFGLYLRVTCIFRALRFYYTGFYAKNQAVIVGQDDYEGRLFRRKNRLRRKESQFSACFFVEVTKIASFRCETVTKRETLYRFWGCFFMV